MSDSDKSLSDIFDRIQRSSNEGRIKISDGANKEDSLIKEELYEKQKEKTQKIREQNRDLSANRELRHKYAQRVFWYLIWYSITVLIILILQGFGFCVEIKGYRLCFELPESVLDFLVGSTAVSAIGLVYSVTHGLFNQR